MAELTLQATTDALSEVLSFVDELLEQKDCPMKIQMLVDIAVEEIYINIAHYAYPAEVGMATIQVVFREDPLEIVVTFIDAGRPYNPLEKQDPNILLSAEDRPIGGLGIYMVKRSVDDIFYQYLDGKNVLTFSKKIV